MARVAGPTCCHSTYRCASVRMAEEFRQRFGCSFEEFRANTALKEALANPNISARRDACRHGAPLPSPERTMMVSQLIEALETAPSTEQQLRRVADWGQRNAAVCQEASRVVYCMATDALLADDVVPAHLIARTAAGLSAYSGVLGDETEVERVTARLLEEWSHLSTWDVRRRVARVIGCGCLGRLALAACALPGCNAAHNPDVPGGAVLRHCARCKRVHYCSEEHQRADWSRHKKTECLDKKATPAT